MFLTLNFYFKCFNGLFFLDLWIRSFSWRIGHAIGYQRFKFEFLFLSRRRWIFRNCGFDCFRRYCRDLDGGRRDWSILLRLRKRFWGFFIFACSRINSSGRIPKFLNVFITCLEITEPWKCKSFFFFVWVNFYFIFFVFNLLDICPKNFNFLLKANQVSKETKVVFS